MTPLPVVPSPKFHAYDAMVPSASDDAAPLRLTAEPAVTDWSAPAFATGGRFVIVATAVSVAVAPLLSVTVNVTVYEPELAYEWHALTPLPVAPSPKFHAYEAIVPSASVEPAPLNDNATSVCAD